MHERQSSVAGRRGDRKLCTASDSIALVPGFMANAPLGRRGDDFLLAKNSMGAVRKVRMVVMQWQAQSLQSGGNFLWELSSLEIVFSRLSKTTFAKTARRSITISFAGTATAKR